MRMPLPESIVRSAEEFSSGERTPAEPRNAATVVLLRPGDDGSDVYLLQRQSSMAFAAGMAVFPGGGVDQRDTETAFDWAGPSPEEWAQRLGVEPPMARALVAAAVRETFEESGVLLAGQSADEIVSDTVSDDWEDDRKALAAHEVSLAEVLVRRDLALRSDLLGAWTGWLTPEFEPRRYRTWFFVASLPAGQSTRDVSSEAYSVSWRPVSGVADAVEAGELPMLPPTYLTCLDIAQYRDPAGVLAEAGSRRVEMFMPVPVERDDGWTLTMPERFERLLDARG